MISYLGEKKGGIRRPDQSMEEFNEMITYQRLVDIPTTNGVYTWNNRRGGKTQIASRLDRFLLSEQILNRDVFIEAKILPGLGSDHWPIRLEIDIKKNNGNKPFRFEAFWLRNPDFLRKMEEWWTQSKVKGKGKMHTIQLKLKEIKGKIKKWNKEEFGNIMEERQKLEKEMEEIQQKIILEGRDEERSNEEGRIINQLEERRKQEEILWRQKSRIKWLREGERNTKFFHQAMFQNRQRNQIFSIKNVEAERIIEQGDIGKVLVDYHKEILTEPQRDRGEAIEYICKEISRLIKNEQNKALMRAATMEEVEEIVMNMKKSKAPGPDGYTVEFYQIIATLIAKRLKPLLPNIISPEQTGIVEGRQILDGLVVTQEMIHSLNQKKQRGMMMKLDLSKDYDRLSWKYLRAVLEACGFEKRWIEWVYSMISMAIFSILVNGIPTNTFNTTRGIRQGDPISPFLFIMAVEGLGRNLKRELREKRIKGLEPWGNNLKITHQQFVDDIILFRDVSIKEEIHEGSSTKFWEDGWQQRDKLSGIQTLQEVQQIAKRAGLEYVRDYWQDGEISEIWRTWRKPEEWYENINQDLEKIYTKEVELRKIKIRLGMDILRWGRSMKGTFTVKEAYYLATKQEREDGETDWRIIWEGKWWPKITIFAWLVSKERTLTWDKIQKRGFYGPSRCSLCTREDENQKHILNKCPFARYLWEKIRLLFGKTKRDPNIIHNTIMQWGKGKFLSRVVRRIWNLSVGFVIWFLWKERNRRIFRGQSCQPERIWEEVCKSIKETVLSEAWEEEDWRMDQEERGIVFNLNMDFGMIYPRKENRSGSQIQSPNQFRYPGEHFIKLNFDGASKGNPGPAGLGGIFRDNKEKTRWVFAEWGGEMTNNEAELWAMHQGLRIAVRNRYMNLEIEGDL
eukprot:PITA_03926